MSDGTKIEWTDATVNAINGCTVLSPGCTNCYAMRLAGTRLRNHPTRAGLTRPSKAGPVWNGNVRLNEEQLLQPLRWMRPRRIFWNAHGEMFHQAVPDAWIDRCFAVMALTPHHVHQVLTKRADRMRTYFADAGVEGRIARAILDLTIANPKLLAIAPWPVQSVGELDEPADVRVALPLPNVWLGVSVEDQQRADERIPNLLATPAAIRWLSCEPMLGPIDLGQLQDCLPVNAWLTWLDGLDWIVVGGESGPGARPMHNMWAKNLRDQCAATAVPFFFKQWGDWSPVCAMSDIDTDHLYYKPRHVDASRRCKVDQLVMQASGRVFPLDEWSRCTGENPATGDFAHLAGTGAMTFMRIGKSAAGRLLDGVQHDGMPS